MIDRPPDWAGKVVGTAEYKGTIYVACEYGVFQLVNDVFLPIRFTERISEGLPKQTA